MCFIVKSSTPVQPHALLFPGRRRRRRMTESLPFYAVLRTEASYYLLFSSALISVLVASPALIRLRQGWTTWPTEKPGWIVVHLSTGLIYLMSTLEESRGVALLYSATMRRIMGKLWTCRIWEMWTWFTYAYYFKAAGTWCGRNSEGKSWFWTTEHRKSSWFSR